MQTRNNPGKKLWSKGKFHKCDIKALFNQPLAKNAVTTSGIDETTGKIFSVKQQKEQVQAQGIIRVDRLDLDPQQRTVFDRPSRGLWWDHRPTEGMNGTSNEYQNCMNQIATLVSGVTTKADIPDRIRAALQYFIERNIRPFIINGVIPVRGG